MTNNIDQVLNRGEKLDNLVTKSEQLGDQVSNTLRCQPAAHVKLTLSSLLLLWC